MTGADKGGEEDRAFLSGMGICIPLGRSLDEVCDAVLAGRDAMIPVDRFDASPFRGQTVSIFPKAAHFAVPPLLRPWVERTAIFALEALQGATCDSKLDWKSLEPTRVAVVVGTSNSGIERLEEVISAAEPSHFYPRHLVAVSFAHLAAVVSHAVGAEGPRITFSSACASSTAGLGHALDLIRDDRADVVVVVGADAVSRGIMAGFNSLGALAGKRTAPFSLPPGITLGDGAGVVIIERSSRVKARGAHARAEVVGYALSGDAYHATSPDREGRGIEQAVRMALNDACMTAADLDYISAHGTGTEANDAAESLATFRIFGDRVPVSSPKSFLGHTLGASGVIETIITLLLAEKGYVPPTVNFTDLRPGCAALDYVPNTPKQHPVRRFICNNYAFGGNNAATLFDRVVEKSPLRVVTNQQVAVTGLGSVTAAGQGLATLEEALGVGKPLSCRMDGEPWPQARVASFAFSDKALKTFARASPMIKYVIEAVHEATRGLSGDDREGCGMIMGVVNAAQRSTERFMESILGDTPELASPQHFAMTTMNAVGGQASIAHRLKGYNTTLAGAAAAAAYSFTLVRRQRQNQVVVASCDETTPALLEFYKRMGLMRGDIAEPFDGGHGFNHGEGSAALLLEGLDAAKQRGATVHAILTEVVEAQDPKLAGQRADGRGLTQAIRHCLERADIDCGKIGAIFATGTATSRIQQAERAALTTVFGDRLPPVHSTAGVTGFMPASTPLVSLMGAILRLKGVIPSEGDRNGASVDHVLVICTDLTGPYTVFLVSRP